MICGITFTEEFQRVRLQLNLLATSHSLRSTIVSYGSLNDCPEEVTQGNESRRKHPRLPVFDWDRQSCGVQVEQSSGKETVRLFDLGVKVLFVEGHNFG